MNHERFFGVLAGGSGERFWPMSRRARPKQFLQMPGSEASMLELTLARIRPLVTPENLYIITSPPLKAPMLNHLGALTESQILVEPVTRNTGGAICWATAELITKARKNGNEFRSVVMGFVPADHYVGEDDLFATTVEEAYSVATSEDCLVTIGIPATRPETGFGYIEMDPNVPIGAGFKVSRFREKPNADLAQTYVDSEHTFWNSGMFFWRVGVFLDQLRQASPLHARVIDDIVAAFESSDCAAATTALASLPNLSIDYALLERASSVAMVPARFNWDDLGTWDAMGRFLQLDSAGNASCGANLVLQATDCLAFNTSKKTIACIADADHLLIVVTDDAVLVADRRQLDSVKKIVEKLKEIDSQYL